MAKIVNADVAPEPAKRELSPYTPGEFREAVLGSRPRTAVFDCDGTLWSPDAGYGFYRWSLEQGMVSAERRSWIEARYQLYEAGLVDEATICGEMVQIYAGLREEAVSEAARTYIRAHIEPFIFGEMAALVEDLRSAGADIWAVSSTSRWVIEAGLQGDDGKGFLIARERILAVELDVENGLITDHVLAVPTDEAKSEALIAAGVLQPDVVFGNSIHDAAMLALARNPFPVNANTALAAFARERGWRCFMPQGS